MADNAKLSDFVNAAQDPYQGDCGVILERSATRVYLSVGDRATVPSHNNINVEEVVSAVACSSCGDTAIVRGAEGEHTGEGSVQTYTYAPVGHCIQCGEFCEAWVIFHVDGTNLHLYELQGQTNCTLARISNLERFKQVC